jgi:hypothetical protein
MTKGSRNSNKSSSKNKFSKFGGGGVILPSNLKKRIDSSRNKSIRKHTNNDEDHLKQKKKKKKKKKQKTEDPQSTPSDENESSTNHLLSQQDDDEVEVTEENSDTEENLNEPTYEDIFQFVTQNIGTYPDLTKLPSKLYQLVKDVETISEEDWYNHKYQEFINEKYEEVPNPEESLQELSEYVNNLHQEFIYNALDSAERAIPKDYLKSISEMKLPQIECLNEILKIFYHFRNIITYGYNDKLVKKFIKPTYDKCTNKDGKTHFIAFLHLIYPSMYCFLTEIPEVMERLYTYCTNGNKSDGIFSYFTSKMKNHDIENASSVRDLYTMMKIPKFQINCCENTDRTLQYYFDLEDTFNFNLSDSNSIKQNNKSLSSSSLSSSSLSSSSSPTNTNISDIADHKPKKSKTDSSESTSSDQGTEMVNTTTQQCNKKVNFLHTLAFPDDPPIIYSEKSKTPKNGSDGEENENDDIMIPDFYSIKNLKFRLYHEDEKLWKQHNGNERHFHTAVCNSMIALAKQSCEKNNIQWQTEYGSLFSMIPSGEVCEKKETISSSQTDNRETFLVALKNLKPTEDDVREFVDKFIEAGGATTDVLEYLETLWKTITKGLNPNTPEVTLMELVLLTPYGFLLKHNHQGDYIDLLRCWSETSPIINSGQSSRWNGLTGNNDNSLNHILSSSSTSSSSQSLSQYHASKGPFSDERFKILVNGPEKKFISRRDLSSSSTTSNPLNKLLLDFYQHTSISSSEADNLLRLILGQTGYYHLKIYLANQELLQRIVVKACELLSTSGTVHEGASEVISLMSKHCEDIIVSPQHELDLNCNHLDLLSYLINLSGFTHSIGVHSLLQLINSKKESGHHEVFLRTSKLFSTSYQMNKKIGVFCKEITNEVGIINGMANSRKLYCFDKSKNDSTVPFLTDELVINFILSVIENAVKEFKREDSTNSGILNESWKLMRDKFLKGEVKSIDELVTGLTNYISATVFSIKDDIEDVTVMKAKVTNKPSVPKAKKKFNRKVIFDYLKRNKLLDHLTTDKCDDCFIKKDGDDLVRLDQNTYNKIPRHIRFHYTELRKISYRHHNIPVPDKNQMDSNKNKNNKDKNPKNKKNHLQLNDTDLNKVATVVMTKLNGPGNGTENKTTNNGSSGGDSSTSN